MSEELISDAKKGELRILGQRHIAMDAEALCRHLDACVGLQIAEVIINNHEFRLGIEDVQTIRRQNPQVTDQQIVDILIRSEELSGTGVTRVTLPHGADAVELEIANPAIKGTGGAAKALILSYWCGAISSLLKRDHEIANLEYDSENNVLRGQLKLR